ncbi:hypothetical protein JHK85_037696 [Glycine max]|nr:hypothetical protein JHK85_037696 [Glycine max]
MGGHVILNKRFAVLYALSLSSPSPKWPKPKPGTEPTAGPKSKLEPMPAELLCYDALKQDVEDLENSEREVEAENILRQALKKASYKPHEAYEIEMLFVDVLIYKAIIHQMLGIDEAREHWQEFIVVRDPAFRREIDFEQFKRHIELRWRSVAVWLWFQKSSNDHDKIRQPKGLGSNTLQETWAISKHPYYVHTMEEAMASARWKKLLDVNALKEQMETYCENGLQPWSPNKQPYASDVPDSALILRRHGLGSNLFSCLIFNELEAFNPRDQLPFAFVRDHMEPNLKLNMFEVEVFEQVAVEYRHNLKSSDGTIVKKLSSSGRTKRAHPDLLYVNGKHHREEAEIYEGEALCMQKSRLLLDEILLPRGLLPLENIVEMGYNRPTGFVWLKQRNKKEHRFATIGRTVSYETEVTAFVEEHRMRVKTKELFKFDLYLNQIL